MLNKHSLNKTREDYVVKLSGRQMGDFPFHGHPLIGTEEGGTGAWPNLGGCGGHLCGRTERLEVSPGRGAPPSPPKADVSSRPPRTPAGEPAQPPPLSALPSRPVQPAITLPPPLPRPLPPRLVPEGCPRARGAHGRAGARVARPGPAPSPAPGGTLCL